MREFVTSHELFETLHELMTDPDHLLAGLYPKISPEALTRELFTRTAQRQARRARELTRERDGR